MLKVKKTGENKHRSYTVDAAIKEVKKVEEQALNIMIPKELHTEFKIKTASRRTNMKEELIKMISSYIEM